MSNIHPIVWTNLRVTLPDGSNLATDIYRPASGGSSPAILVRTPYGKANHMEEGLAWAQRGFAFVVQDVRGRYDSDGIFEPYRHERADGQGIIAWLAAQPWVDGRVIVMGGSYAAFTAWAVAVGGHPAVRALISMVPAMGPHATAGVRFDRSGILHLLDHVRWWMTHGDARVHRPALADIMLREMPELLYHLPLIGIARQLWAELPTWEAAISAGVDPPAYVIHDAEIAQLAIPTMHIGGWHDVYIEQTLHQWTLAGSALARRPLRSLLVGPWTHILQHNVPAAWGERSYGVHSRLPLGKQQLRWLHSVLSGNTDKPAVRTFLMGSNCWQTADDWPPSAMTAQTWYCVADSQLADSPLHSGSDAFCYDPVDPYPSISWPVDRSKLLARTDVLRYISSPLASPVTILGAPCATLYAATDGATTDWVVRLLEVFPDGRMLYVGHGLVDAAVEVQRGGEQLVPGQVYRFEIMLSPTAMTIPTGHRIGLEISSSDFPEHARNLNIAADRYTTATTRRAHQTIVYGSTTPTSLTLPVAATAFDVRLPDD